MKKNGFTLIELVVTIAIILAITAIAVPSTISLINRSKNSEYNGYIDSFVALSKTYFSDMGYQEDKVVNNVCYQITLDTLEDKQYLEDIPINPKTSEKFKGGVEIKLEGGKVNYKYVENSSCIAPTNDLLANIDDDSVINMSESGDYENILLDVPTIVRQLMAKGNPLYIQSPKTIERSGMFMDQDDFGTTYYFYGSRGYINNIVEFAGHKWIITRVNGDETVRLVLYDTINMNEDNTKTDSNGIRVSEYGTHVFKYEDENPNDDYKNEYINNIQMYNIIHELPITSNHTGSLGGYTDTLNTAISNYTVSTFLENWIDEEISDKSKLVSNVSSDGKRYFCSEFPTNNTNYKCNASNNNTVVTNNLLSKHDIEQAGFDEFSINSFLSNGEKWITNSFNNSTYVSICDAEGESKSNQCNTSLWEATDITAPGFIITNKLEASHNYYYVNNSKLSNKNLISVTGNYLPDFVVDKNVKRTL